ncbi:uncharacterized protein CANTADRAFT_55312 [Suhomyces tanzawaensis NRRL Y-17324]|uniref:1-phosphatidylinositol-3-phosphate 5-kinase n=1 Tax=Suhomyces tanzawaensis NRRL Y-17324 TaxID=984487 RepID=A0A1E4SF58_9ASCO|nr:uncharacterized protein CANTADRAFT_55312 [Suhomyces tanzawaensis NRRL Y-17324]ODV78105.1 hypothetical protein CANTADRAFT_55312 [Suhomyces tanzawaensis NRRL Y-17324]
MVKNKPVSVSSAKDRTLLSKISSIFNNLPNDIELSDDSGSDAETIGNTPNSNSSPSHSHGLIQDRPPELKRSGSTNHHPSCYDISLYSQSTAKSSPVKAELKRSYTNNNLGDSPTLSTIYALRSKDQHGTMKKKNSSNLSTVIFDNAKSILNNNLTTSGAIESTKKTKRPKRSSENPLKSGGIPRKYWMNNSFVADCLNCFKPFTAFRRKHHCRFCGQIFCADCTLFISYNQHKEERKNNGDIHNTKRLYHDKLRVCKPCYSDVIVYLSDDSSSSESDNEPNLVDEHASNPENLMVNHPITRIRSMSINSRRDSLLNEQGSLERTSIEVSNGSPSHRNSISTGNTTTSTPVRFTQENIKIYPRKAPQMAIPTTRTGEAVEIPAAKSSYINHTSTWMNASKQNSASNLSTSHHASEALPNKSWFKSYAQLRTASPDLLRTNSYDNVNNLYNNIIGRKVSNNKLRIKSGSKSKDDKEAIDPNSDNDDADTEESNDENESEIEDEQVMSLYTSLNHNGYSNGQLSPKPSNVNTSLVMPTLGEFPNMVSSFTKIFQGSKNSVQPPINHPILFEEFPKSESLRSRERANASLERMRSRRKVKSNRNLLILTQNRLPSFDNYKLNQVKLSPNLTPTSPKVSLVNLDTSKSKSSTLTMPTDTESHVVQPGTNDDDSHLEDHYSINPFQVSDQSSPSGTRYIDVLPFNKSVDQVYQEVLDFILKQSLEDCDIKETQDEWMVQLKKVLNYVNMIKLTDTLDVKQYVKIKKILGGKIEETNVMGGLFITKNIDSKKMSFSIKNPRIALLMFPIEYLKQKEQFISLRIIHSQQSVYITNLVSKLISMKPDIIIIGDSICGLAMNLLEEAGITIISNAKPQIIERISRYTNSNIFQSVNDLFFKKGQLGQCKKFEVKRYIYNNHIKTYCFFIGNEIETGFTITLRGGNEDTLTSVKYSTETLLPGILNSKFEKSLLRNHLVTFDNDKIDEPNEQVKEYNEKIREIEIDREKNPEMDSCVPSTEIAAGTKLFFHYMTLFNQRKISLSPATKFPLPTPLVNVIDSYYKYHKYFGKNKSIQNCNDYEKLDHTWTEELCVNIDVNKLPNEGDDMIRILKSISSSHLNTLLNDYQARLRLWINCIGISSYQLYPIFHKNIHVLQSSVSIKYSTPCSGPNIMIIDYYTDNDKCLGLFLDQIFQDFDKVCKECGEIMLNHYKTYVHENGKLDLILEKIEKRDDPEEERFRDVQKNQRIMWSYCKECDQSTPITKMNDETYYLSIGKFLELCFYGQDIILQEGSCKHDFFRNHIRYFGYNDLIVRLEYTKIDNYEVIVPRKQLEFIPEIDMNLKVESFTGIQNKSEKFFSSISKRLNRVKLDTFDKVEDGLQKIEELKSKLSNQIEMIKNKTLEIYNSTAPTDYLSLNFVLRELQELGVSWDNEFNEFEKNFLPSENEINKITQFHLRNFLMDKNEKAESEKIMNDKNSDDQSVNNQIETKAVDEETAKKDDDLASESAPSTPTKLRVIKPPMSSLNHEKTKEIGKMIPSSLYLHSIIERISKIEQLLENERNGNQMRKEDIKRLPPPAPLRHLTRKDSLSSLDSIDGNGQPTNKVYQLANLFDKMNIDRISLEFKRQREQELKKKSHKFKALPIVESKPIVEIYDKIEDVVDVNDEEKRGIRTQPQKTSGPTDPKAGNASIGGPTGGSNRASIASTGPLSSKNLDIPQPEKMTLLKSLTNFWADRSATLWDPLDYPLESHEHTFADSDVIVRDDEPSSLVAFCLSSNDYKQKLDSMGKETDLSGGFDLENNEINNKKINNFIKIEKKFKKKDNNEPTTLEKIMMKNKSNHLKYQFVDGNTSLSCKIFYSEQFEAFRRACGNNDNFIQSLSRCIKWNSNGGKSGSNFLKTLDDRYIVKELSKSELESFVSIAPFYFKYISQSMFNTLSTAIAKIFGFYQIQIKNTITGKTYKMDFLIMENLFYNHKTTRIFDLKGSMRNRHVKQTGKENEVLLDENMIEYIYESPVFVKEQLKKLLRGSLFNDTSFLLAMDVMDYSLVIGIDNNTKKLYIGIIDWLRTFTWDKKVENWVKGNNLIGGNKKGKDPTIVTPKQYRARFREAMERYILEVPDIWYEGSKLA